MEEKCSNNGITSSKIIFLIAFMGSLFGFTNLSAQHWLSVGEVYDFEIGDLFVTSGYSESASGGWHDTENRQTEMEVIDKQWSASGDTVFYYFDMKSWKRTLVSENDWEVYINHDTVMRSHSMLDSLMIDIVFNNYIQKYADPNHMHGRIRNELVNAFDTYEATVNGYAEGLGSIRYTRTTYTSTYWNSMIYYKKGEEEWGSYTPISIEEQYLKNRPAPISQMLADNFTKTGVKKDKPDLNTIVQHKGKQLETKEPCFSCLPEGIEFETQAQIDEFQTNYPECTNIEGDVTINGVEIANLNGLNMLTSIGGDFKVFSNTTLSSLGGLQYLSSIGGNFRIYYCNALTSLNGLENLTSIGGYLWIDHNAGLSNLNGMENLTSVDGHLWIHTNTALTSLSGLVNLTSVGKNFRLFYNTALTSLSGLESLTSIGDYLWIKNNPVLISLSGLDNLNTIGDYFWVDDNKVLSQLTGLEGLNSIEGNFWFTGNDSLSELPELNSLTSIGGDLWVNYNNTLTSLSGLDNLEAASIDQLKIVHNSSLSSCEAQWLCDYLGSPNSEYEIHNNASGCNTFIEIAAGCGGMPCLTDDNYVFNAQSEIDLFEAAFPNCTDLEGNVTINGIDITNLSGLGMIISIAGNLTIHDCDGLTSLTGLDNLSSVGNDLNINNNSALTSLSGIENLEAASIDQLTIIHNSSLSSCEAQWLCEYLSSPNSEYEIHNNASGCNIYIEIAAGCGGLPCLPDDNYVFNAQSEIDLFEAAFPNCTDLEGNVTINGIDITNLSGLGMITSIAGNLTIHNCDGLTSLTGLDNLNSVGNDLLIYNNHNQNSLNGTENLYSVGGNLKLYSLPALSSLNGLENLTSVDGHLWITANTALTSLSGLGNLTSIGRNFRLFFNPTLTSLSGLESLTSIEGNLQIIENDALSSLSGLDNLEAASIGQLKIVYNSSLSSCEAQWLCDYLGSPNSEFEISNNASGCNSIIEVAAGCGGMPCLTDDNYVFNSQSDIDLFEAAFPTCTDLEGNVTINGIDITNLSGLEAVTSIAGNLTIHDCDGLASLTGLESLVSISDSLYIMNNNALISLNGLENLTTIGANLKIENNDFLYNLTALEGLTAIGGNLQIIENDTLTSLRGLDNLEAASITNLQIVSNPLLKKCEVNSICYYLSAPGGTIEIHDNAPGCSNPQQVENVCEKLDVEELAVEAEFIVYPNPAKNRIYLTSKNDLKIETFAIYNQIGQKVIHRNEAIDNIDISALESGIYFLELISGELTIRQKLIVSN